METNFNFSVETVRLTQFRICVHIKEIWSGEEEQKQVNYFVWDMWDISSPGGRMVQCFPFVSKIYSL